MRSAPGLRGGFAGGCIKSALGGAVFGAPRRSGSTRQRARAHRGRRFYDVKVRVPRDLLRWWSRTASWWARCSATCRAATARYGLLVPTPRRSGRLDAVRGDAERREPAAAKRSKQTSAGRARQGCSGARDHAAVFLFQGGSGQGARTHARRLAEQGARDAARGARHDGDRCAEPSRPRRRP